MYAYLGLISSFATFPGGGCAGYVVGRSVAPAMWWVREIENKAKLSQLKLEFGLSLAKLKKIQLNTISLKRVYDRRQGRGSLRG